MAAVSADTLAAVVRPPGTPDGPDEAALIAGLRARDERAFLELVNLYHGSLTRLSRRYLSDAGVAEEVVQDTWLAALRGIDRFEGRSSLKTWLFRILANQALTRRAKEAKRDIPFSSLVSDEMEDDEPLVAPERFRRGWFVGGSWRHGPDAWEASPESLALDGETHQVILEAITTLPPAQATVITLRDLHGFTAEEVCETLDISAANQRVLLHRARMKVRGAIEQYLGRT